jgi:hypothetical protein
MQETPKLAKMKAKVRYKFTRLCFRADLIDPLGESDSFCVDTPQAIFIMTKSQFRRVFANVVKSSAYREGQRIYHYRKTPRKALPFLAAGPIDSRRA